MISSKIHLSFVTFEKKQVDSLAMEFVKFSAENIELENRNKPTEDRVQIQCLNFTPPDKLS
jgi:hypothetical protein